ncbi:MAG TPA: SDR family oxidoreductase [Candidatus Paceibacterota bacterium]|nr:SDR family oxidoreductase [Candidatus Paceibacterota bacterium]
MKLKNKVAVITGGSGGIGRVVAEFFVREGARVVIVSRGRKDISPVVKEIAAVTGKQVSGVSCDVADAKAAARAIRGIAKKFRRVDVLVNCAGIQAPIGPFAGNKIEDWENNIAVNLFGTVHACKAVLPFMMKRRSGVIINFAGGGAVSSRPNFSAYAVAKTGVTRLTEILADELKPYHIRVNAISPGGVNTGMAEEVLRVGARAGKAELAKIKKQFQTGGVPPELPAALAVFLASNDSRGLTGRLISAPWDKWNAWGKKQIKAIMAGDKFTLRRKV